MRFFEVDKLVEAWAEAAARPVAQDRSAATSKYATTLATEFSNGSVEYRSFSLEIDEVVLQMAAHFENWKHSKVLELLWFVPGVAESLPEVDTVSADVATLFERSSFFELSSFLGSSLYHGGAYSSASRDPFDCLQLGARCAREMTEGAVGTVLLSNTPWCDFFYDVAWDRTAIVILPESRVVNVLLATDTD